MDKAFYFPAKRAILIGFLLLFVGLLPVMMFLLIDRSILSGLAYFTELFTGFPEIIIGLIDLVILASGVLYITKANKIIWLKLDGYGIHYLPYGEGTPSRAKPLFNMFFLKESLVFISYAEVYRAELLQNKWTGDLIRLHLKNEQLKDIRSVPFSLKEKQEIIALVNKRCNFKLHNTAK